MEPTDIFDLFKILRYEIWIHISRFYLKGSECQSPWVQFMWPLFNIMVLFSLTLVRIKVSHIFISEGKFHVDFFSLDKHSSLCRLIMTSYSILFSNFYKSEKT